MAKKRIHEIAKEQGLSSKDVLDKLQAAGLDVKAASSSVEEGDALRAMSGGPDPHPPAGNGAASSTPPTSGSASAATTSAGTPSDPTAAAIRPAVNATPSGSTGSSAPQAISIAVPLSVIPTT